MSYQEQFHWSTIKYYFVKKIENDHQRYQLHPDCPDTQTNQNLPWRQPLGEAFLAVNNKSIANDSQLPLPSAGVRVPKKIKIKYTASLNPCFHKVYLYRNHIYFRGSPEGMNKECIRHNITYQFWRYGAWSWISQCDIMNIGSLSLQQTSIQNSS